MVVTILVGIAPQVANVFHKHKRGIKLFLEELLSVTCLENQCAVGDSPRALDHFENDAASVCGSAGFSNQRSAVCTGQGDAGGLCEFVNKLCCIQVSKIGRAHV